LAAGSAIARTTGAAIGYSFAQGVYSQQKYFSYDPTHLIYMPVEYRKILTPPEYRTTSV
jgi:hypothetical protein